MFRFDKRDRFHFWRALLARIIVLGGYAAALFFGNALCLCGGFRDKLGNTSLHVIPLYADETTPGFWCRRWSRGYRPLGLFEITKETHYLLYASNMLNECRFPSSLYPTPLRAGVLRSSSLPLPMRLRVQRLGFRVHLFWLRV